VIHSGIAGSPVMVIHGIVRRLQSPSLKNNPSTNQMIAVTTNLSLLSPPSKRPVHHRYHVYSSRTRLQQNKVNRLLTRHLLLQTMVHGTVKPARMGFGTAPKPRAVQHNLAALSSPHTTKTLPSLTQPQTAVEMTPYFNKWSSS